MPVWIVRSRQMAAPHETLAAILARKIGVAGKCRDPASTACAKSWRAPLRRISVSGSATSQVG
jgi:hypothetical protein